MQERMGMKEERMGRRDEKKKEKERKRLENVELQQDLEEGGELWVLEEV